MRPTLLFYYASSDEWIEAAASAVVEACGRRGWHCIVVGQNFKRIDGRHILHSSILTPMSMLRVRGRLKLNDVRPAIGDILKHTGGMHGAKRVQVIKTLLRSATAAKTLLEIVKPTQVVVWNGLVGARRGMVEACRSLGVPVIFAEKGFLPDSWYVDPEGVNARSSFAKRKWVCESETGGVDAWLEHLVSTSHVEGLSAWEQPGRKPLQAWRESLQLVSHKKTVFFAGQVDDDTNIALFSPFFRDVLSALDWLVRGLDSSVYQLLVKPHPKGTRCAADYQETIGDAGVVISSINVQDAIELSDVVVAINSTVLVEAVLHGKPAVQLGKGLLDGAPYVVHYDGYMSVCDALERAFKMHPVWIKQQALCHLSPHVAASYCFRSRPVSFDVLLSMSSGGTAQAGPMLFHVWMILNVLGITFLLERVLLLIQRVLAKCRTLLNRSAFERAIFSRCCCAREGSALWR